MKRDKHWGNRSGEMAQLLRALTVNPVDLNLVTGSHMVQERTYSAMCKVTDNRDILTTAHIYTSNTVN